jgi:omega-amidase
VVSPWGDVIGKADSTEEVIYADLDFRKVDDMRQNIPTSMQKRHDIYQLHDIASTTASIE